MNERDKQELQEGVKYWMTIKEKLIRGRNINELTSVELKRVKFLDEMVGLVTEAMKVVYDTRLALNEVKKYIKEQNEDIERSKDDQDIDDDRANTLTNIISSKNLLQYRVIKYLDIKTRLN